MLGVVASSVNSPLTFAVIKPEWNYKGSNNYSTTEQTEKEPLLVPIVHEMNEKRAE
jgi:hypothetical protein